MPYLYYGLALGLHVSAKEMEEVEEEEGCKKGAHTAPLTCIVADNAWFHPVTHPRAALHAVVINVTANMAKHHHNVITIKHCLRGASFFCQPTASSWVFAVQTPSTS